MLDEYLEPLISQLKALDDENSCETEALLYSRDEVGILSINLDHHLNYFIAVSVGTVSPALGL